MNTIIQHFNIKLTNVIAVATQLLYVYECFLYPCELLCVISLPRSGCIVTVEAETKLA